MGEIKETQKVIYKTKYVDYSIGLPMTISKVRCLSSLLLAKSRDDEVEVDSQDIEGFALILQDIEDDLKGINQELCE